MTICPECRPWAATTHRQLLNRIENMANSPGDITVHPCPKCGGTEWAITDEMVEDELAHGWGKRSGNLTAGLATLSAVIIIVLVIIGWLR